MAAFGTVVLGTACKVQCCAGAALVPGGRWLVTRYLSATLRQCLRLSVPAASLCTRGTEPQRNRKDSGVAGEEERESEGPEYIPLKKAKNPMMNIGYAWMIGLPTGIIGFLLAKRQVDKNRLKQLKVRQRIRNSNEGDYEGSRYRHAAETVKVDQ
ncbi:DUF4748 domain-containing protein isoform X1 [Syngnathus acus]|uniref:DUF4748 domain-containing protein isoform X1 n=1 Tax=Syngnathus acus TaxID=161584 RepID=UPI00188613C7|nr:DUF4748 domain-containing protein isoform X1 [Syngnathus acus]